MHWQNTLWTNIRCECGRSCRNNYSTMRRRWAIAASVVVVVVMLVAKMVIFVNLSCKVYSTTPLVQIKNRSKHILKIYGSFLFEFVTLRLLLLKVFTFCTVCTSFTVHLLWIELTNTQFLKMLPNEFAPVKCTCLLRIFTTESCTLIYWHKQANWGNGMYRSLYSYSAENLNLGKIQESTNFLLHRNNYTYVMYPAQIITNPNLKEARNWNAVSIPSGLKKMLNWSFIQISQVPPVLFFFKLFSNSYHICFVISSSAFWSVHAICK